VRALAGILIAGLVGLALAGVATVTIMETNAPDKAVEQSIQTKNFEEPRKVVQYGQR
jgi:hypothetical protein